MGLGRATSVIRVAVVLAGSAFLLGASLALAAGQVQIEARLVAVSTRDQGVAEIWSFNLDGTGARELTVGPAAHYSPKVSPDGARIAYTGEDGGAFSIYAMNVDGTGVDRLTRAPMSAGSPAWSPDGTSIAFAASSAGASGYQIWTMKADGTGQRQLTHLPGSSNGSPTFSPDGSTIAFASSTPGANGSPASRINTASTDGSRVVPVTAGPNDGYPAYSPADPSSFLFARAAPDGTISRVFRKVVGGGETPLSPAGAFYTEPEPSADGTTFLATGRTGSAGLGLFRLPLDGGASLGPGIPIVIAGGGDTYSPVLIYTPAVSAPSASAAAVAPSASASLIPAQPGVGVSVAVPPSPPGGFSLNLWEVLIGVGIFVVVIGSVTYFVKLRPEKDGCDQQRAEVQAAEDEFEAAQRAFDAAEVVHNAAVASRHNAEAQVNWVSDQPAGPRVDQAHAAADAAVKAETNAYQALVKAGTRQGAARINLDVARKRLADCEALNAFTEDAWASLPPAPEPPQPLSREFIRQVQAPESDMRDMPVVDPKTGKPYPAAPPPGPVNQPHRTARPERPPGRHGRREEDLPPSMRITGDPATPGDGGGFVPVPPSAPPEVKPEVDNREIG
jgi:hypothetical protein